MSQLLKNPLSNSTILTKFYSSNNHYKYNPTLIPKFAVFLNPSNPPFQKLLFLSRNRRFHLKAYDSSSFDLQEREKSNLLFNFDALLSVLESLCVVSSLVIAVGCVVNGVLFKQQNSGLVIIGNRLLVWLLAGSVAVGSVIRRRQWRRFCGPVRVNSGPGLGLEAGNMIERIEKLEESMKSATTIIRMLSRQLEKLGVRFRVMRKALRDPITETAALAQKNSEATRALSVQEDILEKELAEVQKVLLAMQDQQQKQLELILAIAKSGKLLETKQAPTPASGVHENDSADRGLRRADDQHVQARVGKSGAISEKALGS